MQNIDLKYFTESASYMICINRECKKSKCPSGIHANENWNINFATNVGFMGLRLYRKLGQIVDDEDSCEITRIVKSFKPGFPTSSDGEVNNSFELCEIRCLWTIM